MESKTKNSFYTKVKDKHKLLTSNKRLMVSLSTIVLFVSFLACFFLAVTFYNDTVGEKNSISRVFEVMFSNALIHPVAGTDQVAISRSIWIIFAMMVGGMGLAITGGVAQSLTKNPLADASTLGTINATIFLLVISFYLGWISFYVQYIFAIIGGTIAAILLLLIIIFSKERLTKTKFILIGLSISIAFKAISFFFWSKDKGVGSAYSSYLMGGSEKIFGSSTYMPKPWLTLLISSCLIFAGAFVAIINSKGMSVTELGDAKTKALGISVRRVRTLNVLSLLLLVPASVLIVGNLAFVGLIATHVVRISFKTRDYKKIIPLTAVVGMVIALLGLLLNILVPKMNSSIWTTLLGAPMLIYLGWRRL